MNSLALILALLAAEPSRAQRWAHPDARDRRQSRILLTPAQGGSGANYALFEFAPADGTGLPANACDGTSPTVATGQALTFTRASLAYCTKANTNTNIAVGDLVMMQSGVPRVMPGGDGTGGLGLLVEEARTNVLKFSQQFEQSPWSNLSSGPNVTITPDYCVAPDGTMSGDRFQIPAVGVAAYSLRIQSPGTGTASYAYFVRSLTNDAGQIESYAHQGAPTVCGTFAADPNTWSRVGQNNKVIDTPGTFNVSAVDCNGLGLSGAGPQSAQDLCVWQADFNNNNSTWMGTPMFTDGGTTVGVRVDEMASAPVVIDGNTRSMAATWVVPAGVRQSGIILSQNAGAGVYRYSATVNDGGLRCTAIYDGGTANVDSYTAIPLSTSNRVSCSYDGGTIAACLNSVCNTASLAATLPHTTTVTIGSGTGASSVASGVYKRVCVDNVSAARCQ